MELTLPGSLSFMASKYSVLVTGVLAAGVAWALYRYRFQPPNTHRSVDMKTQQALHQYVLFESIHGKPDSVLQAFKEYACKDRVMKELLFTEEQDIFLKKAAKQCNPRTTLVLGTQCGYSAIRLLKLLPAGRMLYAVEEEGSMAELAEEMILVAGFKNNRFKLLCQHPVDAIYDLKNQFGVKKVDFVLMDYQCDQHVECLLALADDGILHRGTLILANNTDHATSKDFISYIEEAESYRIVDACKGLLKVEYVQSD